MKSLILLTFFLATLNLSAQWSDNFSDGNFTQSPMWSGDADKYIVNTTRQLQLNAPSVNGYACLGTSSAVATQATWSFWVGMDFNPSSGNYAKVYMVADEVDLSGSLHGYFLRIGGTNDDLCLFRQDGDNETLVVDGRNNVLNTSAVNARIRVTRDKLGNWELYCDTTGGTNFRLSGKGVDKEITVSSYSGLQCIFTSTRCSKFFFDDFVVTADGQTDGVKPSIASLAVLDNRRLRITFSEPVNFATATKTGNYISGNNSLSSIVATPAMPCGYDLSFTAVLGCESDNTLQIKNITDLSGLCMNDTVLKFRYCTPEIYDVVFNEIMADPTPAMGLPETEYLELYNRSAKTLNLIDWQLTIGSSVYTFPEITLPANGYLLITTKEAMPAFTSYGTVMALLSSSTCLVNAGQYLKLTDASGNLISWLEYSNQWYGDDFKADGGWSLEQIDPANPCAGKDNWKASVAGLGGTPGAINSVYASNTDGSLPVLLRAHIPADTVVYLYFSEPLDSSTSTNVTAYKITPDLGHPLQASVLDRHYAAVRLLFSHRMQKGILYRLTVAKELTDCVGNKQLNNQTMNLGIPLKVENSDVVINEVLFDANAGGVEYVELYNRSGKILNASKLWIATRTDGALKGITRLSETGFLFLPSSYLVVTASEEKVKLFYASGGEECFVELASPPSLPDKASTIVLLNDTLGTVDEFSYLVGMHIPTIKVTEGVSLERVNPDKAANFPGNWHSAAQTVGYGTPGLRNSQYLPDSVATDAIELAEKMFSPDNDGYHDVLQVQYKFAKPGCRVQVNVYDASGRLMRRIFNNELLGVEGSFVWDGTSDAGNLCGVGMYVIFVRTVFDDGTVQEYKKVCVLTVKR